MSSWSRPESTGLSLPSPWVFTGPFPNSGPLPTQTQTVLVEMLTGKKGINSWERISRAGDSWPEDYTWADRNHLPHRTRAARVRPGEDYAQTADDGSGSFCLPCIFSLSSGIPKRYRQIRGPGCNQNLHLFTQGWAGQSFKSNFNTLAAKPPARQASDVAERGLTLLPSCSATPTQDPHLHNPHHFGQSEVCRHWRCFPRHHVYPWLSQFCLSPDTKHSLKPFCYRPISRKT